MFHKLLPRSQPVALTASAACASVPRVGRSLVLTKFVAVVTLVAIAPMAAAQLAPASSSRAADESVWGPFVYERLGATPTLTFGRSAAAPIAVAASVASRLPDARAAGQTGAISTGAASVSRAGQAVGSESGARASAPVNRVVD